MDLNTLWFVLVAVLFTGFFVLEGFDYGVGILLPFVASSDEERRRVINTIGPVWDGNEVWILTGGGAIFAAFPHWYATLFSGFYLALFLILVGLIVRGVAFEFRSKHESPAWRATWDRGIFWGSLLPAKIATSHRRRQDERSSLLRNSNATPRTIRASRMRKRAR